MLNDSAQRLEAIDPAQSFIVQAPAGSGKTELLTQRFLKLLAIVQEPENIVALTFTRKAASEMKERILAALRKTQETSHIAISPHQVHTFKLAEAAMQQDNVRKWHILKHPHRLRIMTIDALCQRFNTAIPLFEKALPFAIISDAPQTLYEQAARACLHDALAEPTLVDAIKTLLKHLDNQQDRLIELFCDRLACRDQWLSVIYTAKQLTREELEAGLKHIEEHTLSRLRQTIPFTIQIELQSLCQQMAIIENNPQSPRDALTEWHDFESFNRPIASGLAHLLLTQDDALRRGFDHHVGLKKDRCPDFQSIKARSQALCEVLKSVPDFEQLLGQVKRLPPPIYSESEWQVLQALLTLLPVLVAELHLIFKQSNAVDFTAVTLQALQALGDEDHPTDLTLYLDHQIHHLLIDEFQDTSQQQVQLIEQIVRYWQPDDGKTLFVVGDPMQSIYRFRQAEVGLFLKVRNEGIAGLSLTSLELTSNFRSTATIIEWINTHFKIIFPYQEDIESGAVSFHPSMAVIPASETSGIEAHQFANKQDEADGIVTIIQQQLKIYPDENIAILVRSRPQLTHIIQALREAKIPFQGVEINSLSRLAHLRDMWSLTKALIYPADRLSWIALLRSPYAGLSLADLHILATVDPKKSIFQALQQTDSYTPLSEEGRMRAQYFYQVMDHALATRHQRPLLEWIIDTAQHLHAKYLLETQQALEIEQFWQLLERYFQQAPFPDLEKINQELERLYSKQSIPAKVQIMTIHKSKGLEFDTVIMPGLGSQSNRADNPLIRWLQLPGKHRDHYLLVSPIKAADEVISSLYQYLNDIESEKSHYELQRLFYVAATRAKKRLFLCDHQDRQNQGSFRYLLKHQTWQQQEDSSSLEETAIPKHPTLMRLPIHFYREPFAIPESIINEVPTLSPASHARQIGIIAHELLQWICTMHPTDLNDIPWTLVQHRARQHGFAPEQRRLIQQQLNLQIETMLSDPIGQWICQRHIDEQNEYALLVKQGSQTRQRIIDRTFIAEGIHWIIDFKTGEDDQDKQAEHKNQVNHYAALLAPLSNHPIHGGIYYLTNNHWMSWKIKDQTPTLANSP